jgi:hypothetical protein
MPGDHDMLLLQGQRISREGLGVHRTLSRLLGRGAFHPMRLALLCEILWIFFDLDTLHDNLALGVRAYVLTPS